MSEWNATLYDNKHDFVAEYGKGLLEYIPQNKNQMYFRFRMWNRNTYCST